MSNATGIPSILWVFIWLGASVLITALALRVYSAGRGAVSADSAFDSSAI
jgi:hypothetical protein